MENNIEIVRQVLKSFGYRHTSSLFFEKPIGFARICVEIKNDIDNGLMLKGKIIAFKNGECTICSESVYLLYINTENWNEIDWNTKLNMEDLSRVIAQFENELISSEDLQSLNYFYINKEFTPLNFITQREILEMLDL